MSLCNTDGAFTGLVAERSVGHFGKMERYSSVHLAKPEPAIYQLLLTKYNLNACECIFIDDRKDNVDAAISLGMSGIVYPGTADRLSGILQKALQPDKKK